MQVFLVGSDLFHAVQRLFYVAERFHAGRELYCEKLPEIASPDANGFPSLAPCAVAQRFVNLCRVPVNIVIIIAASIHTDSQKHQKIHIEFR